MSEEHGIMHIEESSIEVFQGGVTFHGYERLKGEALRLADQVATVRVSEENVAESKRLLAAVNKSVKQIEDRRIGIKREILEPYDMFEQQVKEIVAVVKEANDTVRVQLNVLEEQARDDKENAIVDLFNKRLEMYEFPEELTAVDFMKNEYLNKSKTMKSIEGDMVEWFESVDSDLEVIYSIPDSAEVLAEYLTNLQLSTAMNVVTKRRERTQELERQQAAREEQAALLKEQRAKQKKTVAVEPEVTEEVFMVAVHGKKDFAMLKMLMDQNDIKYTLEKGNN